MYLMIDPQPCVLAAEPDRAENRREHQRRVQHDKLRSRHYPNTQRVNGGDGESRKEASHLGDRQGRGAPAQDGEGRKQAEADSDVNGDVRMR